MLGYDHSLLLEERSLLCPPRIREICKPLLKAWLKSILVWNSETNGNHAKKATGVKRSKPIIISYPRASARTDPQNPAPWMRGLQACAIFERKKKKNAMSKRSNRTVAGILSYHFFFLTFFLTMKFQVYRGFDRRCCHIKKM